MKANVNTAAQEITEVEQLRQKIAELEKSNAEIQQAKEALRESEERLKNIMENVNEVIFQLSPVGVIEYVSPKVKELYGYKPEELVGKHLEKTTPLPEVPKALEVLKKALSGKIVKNFEIDQLDKNGKIVHMEISGTPVKMNGTVIAVQGFMRDITERKQAEDTLRETSLFLRNILDSSFSISIVFTDLEQNILFWNKGAENIFGYKAEEVVGRHTVEILYPDDEKDIKQTVAEIRSFIVNKKRGIRREIKKVTKDGRILWINLTSTPRLDENGHVIGILGIGEDITERKHAEEMLKKAHQELEKRVEKRTAELSEINVLMRKEITERERMEETLRKSEEKYRELMNGMNDTAWVIDFDGNFIDVNDAAVEVLGYSREELLAMGPNDIDSRLDDKKIANLIKGMPTDELQVFETMHTTKDGNTIPVEIKSSLITYQGQQAILSIARDITERKQMEEELRNSEERFRKVVETMEVGLGAIDKNGVFTYVNEYLAKMLGYMIDEMIGRSTLDFYYDEKNRKAQEEIFAKRRAGNRDPTPYEITWRRKGGQKVHTILSPTPMFDADGHYTGSFAIHTDITERKRMEEALRESEEKFRTFMETASDLMHISDKDLNFTYVNDAMARTLGYSKEEMIGMNLAQILKKEVLQKDLKRNLEVLKKQGEMSFESIRVAKDGKEIYGELKTVAIFDKDGAFAGTRGVFRDITERKRADEKLKANFDTLSKNLESTVSALASAFEVRDPYTAGHQQRVTDLACAIAEDMGLGVEQIAGIRMAGLIHDIGKINIPAEILNKPGQLTEIEYSLFKNHPQVGHDVLQTVEFPWPVAQIVLQHHERMDGSGYPQGLSGDDIMLEARILAVADIVEAIASHRPYRPARGAGDALEEILHNKGTLYDPEVVDACLRVFYERGFKFEHVLRVATSPKIH